MHKSGLFLIKGVFILLFVILLAGGFALYLADYTPVTELSGAYVRETFQLPASKREILKGIGSGELLSKAEQVYNQDFPLRPFSIKLNNTIDFLQGKSTNASVCVGKNRELYEYDYLWDYEVTGRTWDGEANKEALRNIAEKLSYIKKEFNKQGKFIYVLITPNKADFSEDNIPDSIVAVGKRKKGNAYRNIDVLKEYFKEYGISYFDSTEYIRQSLPSQVIPFYRSGIHYSWPAGYYAARELFARIEKETGLNMPHFDLTVKEQEEVVFPNRDLFDLLNTFPEITGHLYDDQPQQQVYIENLEPSPISVLMQGGSFLGPYIDMINRYPGVFKWFDIIQNTIFMPQGDTMIQLGSIRDVDLGRIQNDQLFIFEVSETSSGSMSFGFIDYLSEYLGTAEYTSLKPYSLIFSKPETVMPTQPYGIYDLAAYDLPWRFTAKQFGCSIENDAIQTNGIDIQTMILDDLRNTADDGRVLVNITVNGTNLGEYEPDGSGRIHITSKELETTRTDGNHWAIDCSVNCSFIPHELNPDSTDTRELSLILYSIAAGTEEDSAE